MSALTYGIIAALCWGIHDVCVRYLSQRVSIFAALFLVVLSGTVLLAPAMITLGQGALPDTRALMFAIGAGIAFALAGLSHPLDGICLSGRIRPHAAAMAGRTCRHFRHYNRRNAKSGRGAI